MKRLILTACVVLAGAGGLCAEEFSRAGKLGAGVELGEQNGGTIKYWLDNTSALDAGLGVVDGDLGFHFGYLWHSWKLLPQPAKGQLGLHLGVGGAVRGDDFGIRTIGGADYWVSGAPLEIFLDAGPIFELTEDNDVDFTAVIGLRYYFGTSASAKAK